MIVSPCISICKTDPVSGLCYGCGRSDEEKKIWKDPETTDDWKNKNLKEIENRLSGWQLESSLIANLIICFLFLLDFYFSNHQLFQGLSRFSFLHQIYHIHSIDLILDQSYKYLYRDLLSLNPRRKRLSNYLV